MYEERKTQKARRLPELLIRPTSLTRDHLYQVIEAIERKSKNQVSIFLYLVITYYTFIIEENDNGAVLIISKGDFINEHSNTNIREDYQIGKVLGTGAFGEVRI